MHEGLSQSAPESGFVRTGTNLLKGLYSEYDDVLFNALRVDGESALLFLMAKHKYRVFRFAFRYLQDVGKASAVVEDAFVQLYFLAQDSEPPGNVSTLLLSIAADLCKNAGGRD